MILEGLARTEAAELNGMDRQTLRNWVHRCNAFGVKGLKSRRSPGRAPALTQLQRAELFDLVITGFDAEVHVGPLGEHQAGQNARQGLGFDEPCAG
jgi:transposase